MTTRPKPVDCDELRACASACADALVRAGHAEGNLSPFAIACDAAVPGKSADPKRDALVRVVLWLCDCALPANDGTRAASREAIATNGPAGVLAASRGEFIAAFYADGVQKEVAGKVRALGRGLDEIEG